MFNGFSKDTLKFLRELKKNNDREWFAEQKPRYEKSVLFPAMELVEAMAKPIEKISPCFQAIAKRSGGSIMRIYRDVRFSKDKSPYKTNLGIHFRHIQGKNVHAPGFYFHVSPEEIFFGAGIWCPPNPDLNRIRSLIDDDPDRWKKILRTKAIKSNFEKMGSSLKRPPRGYLEEPPLIDDLKMKDHILVTQMDKSDLLDQKLVNKLSKNVKATINYVRFLCEALNLPA
jgi:uncharacterized protein (TIGR02453 family)